MALRYTDVMALVRFMLRLPTDLKAWLEVYAEREGKKQTDVVNDALRAVRRKDEKNRRTLQKETEKR